MRTHSAFLIELLKDRKVSTVAEIGVFRGDNAYALLDNLNIGLFVGVDPYLRYPEFDNNLSNKTGVMASVDLERVKKNMLHRMKAFADRFVLSEKFSAISADLFSNDTFDFVFIDGNHYYEFVCDDILSWMPKVKQGGILAGHDYVVKSNCGVIQATEELLPDLSVNLLAKVWWYEIPILDETKQ